jgi:hypothetical protein
VPPWRGMTSGGGAAARRSPLAKYGELRMRRGSSSGGTAVSPGGRPERTTRPRRLPMERPVDVKRRAATRRAMMGAGRRSALPRTSTAARGQRPPTCTSCGRAPGADQQQPRDAAARGDVRLAVSASPRTSVGRSRSRPASTGRPAPEQERFRPPPLPRAPCALSSPPC